MSNSNATERIRIQSSQNSNAILLECWKHADRYRHQIGCLIDGEQHIILESIEGTNNEIWPASPPLQQVYQQQIENDPVILAVGMAGKNHYSMSARICEYQSGSFLKLEMACLLKQNDPNRFLGTTYRLNPAFCCKAEDDSIQWFHADKIKKFATLEVENCARIKQNSNPPNDEIAFVPSAILEDKPTQWSYLVRIVNP